MTDEWALTSVSVWDGSSQTTHHEVAGDTLESQFTAAEALLRSIASHHEAQPGAELSVRLFSSWTPAPGQHAMTLPQELIRAPAAVNGTVWMDFYPSDEDEEPITQPPVVDAENQRPAPTQG